MSSHSSYIRTDEHGVMRVGGTGVPLDSVVAGFLQGCSAETIQEQYPSLTLEQVYGAIAFYLGHRSEVDAYLGRQQHVWNTWRQRADDLGGSVVRRLRTLRDAPEPHPS